MMWKPSVNAIWLRAAPSSDAIGQEAQAVRVHARSTLDSSP